MKHLPTILVLAFCAGLSVGAALGFLFGFLTGSASSHRNEEADCKMGWTVLGNAGRIDEPITLTQSLIFFCADDGRFRVGLPSEGY